MYINILIDIWQDIVEYILQYMPISNSEILKYTHNSLTNKVYIIAKYKLFTWLSNIP